MKETLVKATQTQFDGRQLPAPIVLENVKVVEYEKYDEIVAQNDLPSHEDVVDFRNGQRIAAAKAKALNDERTRLSNEWKAANPNSTEQNPYEKATIANSETKRFENIVASLMAAGKTKERAEQIARMSLEA